MRQWIKFETDIMDCDAVRRLFEAKSLKGLGMYVILRLYIKRASMNGMSYQEVLSYGNNFGSRILIQDVLENYGLFDLRGGMVKVLPTCTEASTGTGTEASTGTGTEAGTGTGEPTSEENRTEKKVEKVENVEKEELSDEEIAWQKAFKEHYPILASMEKPLTLAQCKKLNEKYTDAEIKAKLERMENYPGITKRYTSTYLTLNNWLKN